MTIKIHLVTHLTGFPFGTAAAHRIRMIGKALIASGIDFKVYTNNIFVDNLNMDQQGIFDEIPYLNLHGPSLTRNKFIRVLLFFKGLVILLPVIFKMKPKIDVVYVYAHGYGVIFNLYVLLLCKLFRIKVVQEINEWYHNDIRRKTEKYFAEGPMLRLSAGAIVISKNIDSIVCKIDSDLKTVVIPVLGEPFNNNTSIVIKSDEKYCFWMGLVDGYLEDLIIIIKACAIAYKKGKRFSFVIAGSFNNDSRNQIFTVAAVNGFPENNIRMLGYISDDELSNYCKNAYFYIIPLWETERSSSRFATKMAIFTFCAKPLISCKIGDPGIMMEDGENVLFYQPGNILDLSEKIEILFENKTLYHKLCINTHEFAMRNFYYKNYSNVLNSFFESIVYN